MTVWLAKGGGHERCGLIAGPTINTRAIGEGTPHGRHIAGGDGVEQRIACSGYGRRKDQRKNCQESAHDPAVSRVREVHKELMNHQPHPANSSIAVQIKCVRSIPAGPQTAAGTSAVGALCRLDPWQSRWYPYHRHPQWFASQPVGLLLATDVCFGHTQSMEF